MERPHTTVSSTVAQGSAEHVNVTEFSPTEDIIDVEHGMNIELSAQPDLAAHPKTSEFQGNTRTDQLEPTASMEDLVVDGAEESPVAEEDNTMQTEDFQPAPSGAVDPINNHNNDVEAKDGSGSVRNLITFFDFPVHPLKEWSNVQPGK